MTNPTSKSVRKIVALLTSILPMAISEEHLDMNQGFICTTEDHICGTTNCHGGWYAISKGLHYRRERRFLRKDRIIPTGADFSDGIRQMTKDLGFSTVGDPLLRWVTTHPDIWGNCYGGRMFLHPSAFYHPVSRPLGAQCLQHIIDHWSEVATRLERMEQDVEISNPPVTAEGLLFSLEWESETASAQTF